MTVQLGFTVHSKSLRHAESTLPRGGIVIDTWADPDTGELLIKTVNVYRGRINYTTFPEADVDGPLEGRLLRRDVLKQMALLLTQDAVRHKDPFRHDHALHVIAGVLEHAGDRVVTRGRR